MLGSSDINSDRKLLIIVRNVMYRICHDYFNNPIPHLEPLSFERPQLHVWTV